MTFTPVILPTSVFILNSMIERLNRTVFLPVTMWVHNKLTYIQFLFFLIAYRIRQFVDPEPVRLKLNDAESFYRELSFEEFWIGRNLPSLQKGDFIQYDGEYFLILKQPLGMLYREEHLSYDKSISAWTFSENNRGMEKTPEICVRWKIKVLDPDGCIQEIGIDESDIINKTTIFSHGKD